MPHSALQLERPLGLRVAAEGDLATCVAWMNDPRVAAPLDIRPPVTMNDLRQRRLPCYNPAGEAVHDIVRLTFLVDATDRPLGFGISYGWDRFDDVIRELDFAVRQDLILPAWVALEGMVRLFAHTFEIEEAIEIRCRTNSGRLMARLFGALGAREVKRPLQVDLARRSVQRRILYAVQGAAFYASGSARRCLGERAGLSG